MFRPHRALGAILLQLKNGLREGELCLVSLYFQPVQMEPDKILEKNIVCSRDIPCIYLIYAVYYKIVNCDLRVSKKDETHRKHHIAV